MIIAEKKLADLITELHGMKPSVNSHVVHKIILLIQKLCATNVYIDTSTVEVDKQYSYLKGYIEVNEASYELSSDQANLYNSKLDHVLDLLKQVTKEIGYIPNRPELKHIDSHCNSSIALALSFLDRWSLDSDPTHGSNCDFGLYVINSPENKDQVFSSTFGMATLKLIKEDIEKLDIFESLNLHSHIK